MFHPDFLVERSLFTLSHGGDPDIYRYPGGLLIYLNIAVYQTAFEVSSFFGWTDPETGIRSFYKIHEDLAQTLGHLITIAFSVAGVVLTYLVGYRLIHDRAFAFAAALFLSTSVLWVADSHFVTVDVPMASLALLTVYLSLSFTASGAPLTPLHMVALGAGVGLSASVKYPGALVAISVAASTWPCYRGMRLRWLSHNALAGVISLAVFVGTNPFIVGKFERFRSDLLSESRHARVGHFGYEADRPWLFHLTETLVHAVGPVVLGLALAGLAWLVRTASIPRRSKLATLGFPLALYLTIGKSHLAFHRYMLPILPFVAILACLGAFAVSEWLQHRRPQSGGGRSRHLVLALAIVAALPNAAMAVRHDRVLGGEDTRSILRRILTEVELAPEIRVYSGRYLQRILPPDQRLKSLEAPKGVQADLLLLDSFSHDRYLYASPPGPRSRGARLRAVLEKQGLQRSLRVAISPYVLPREEVPFSPKSVYSPYPPDLRARRSPGPYIEIFSRDHQLIQRISKACRKLAIDCERSGAPRSFFYQAIKAL